MRPIFIIFGSFFGLLILISFYYYRRKNIGLYSFVVSAACFLLLAIFSLYPDLVDLVAGILGLKLRANFLITVLVIITGSFIFLQIKANNKARQDLNQVIQLLGIQRFYLGLPTEPSERPGKRSNILIKMAAYNEKMNVGAVLSKMPDSVDVLVIDDGSTDGTGREAIKHGAMVLRQERNLGQGVADLTGFQAAFDMGYEYIIEMDADGQHNPEDIPRFIRELDNHPELDIVVGSRVLGSQNADASKIRTVFLPLYTKMINWASGYSLTDGMCGFKAYRAASFLKCPHVFTGLIETEYIAAELYIRFGRTGLKVGEIPIHVLSRAKGKSHKGTFRYGFAVAWVIMRSFFDLSWTKR